MKRLLFFTLFFLSVKTFADAGYAYRFYIKAEVERNKIEGYLYHYSYEKYDETKGFYNYLKETSYRNDFKIHKKITTINLGLNYDFVIKDSDIKLSFSQVENLELVDYLCFPSGDRLIELTKKEFELISCFKVSYKVVMTEGEISFAENCSYVIISLRDVDSLSKRKKTVKKLINDKIKKLRGVEGEIDGGYYNYYNQLRGKLLEEKILLISICSAL
ncbi:hypothetical protein [Tenacibaculum crassostreae]|uniref:hypothetical protein n=1 Tax=Tenacibaculum crassostreae TaxID=502683 RepID=UPI0038942C09